MYITSDCYGTTPMVGIKCPRYAKIEIHDVIMGVKREPDCPSDVSANQQSNPICCRPSCNDCFQRADVIIHSIIDDCNGLNACHVKPQWKLSGACHQNKTEYMAVAYNCHIPTKTKGNITTSFSIDENLCGRKSKSAIVLPLNTGNSSDSNLETYANLTTLQPLAPTKKSSARPTDLTNKPTPPVTRQATKPPTTDGGQLAKVSVASTIADITVPHHRTPTKRFVSTGRVRFSSTSTSFTQLGMANRPDHNNHVAASNQVNRGAMIGGVAAAAGLLVFVLSLAMLRRRRRKVTRRPELTINTIPESHSIERPRSMSPVEDMMTPTSLSEEGQSPWTFGPPDLNIATVHCCAERPIPVTMQNLPPNIVGEAPPPPQMHRPVPDNRRQNICTNIPDIALMNDFDEFTTRSSIPVMAGPAFYSQKRHKEARKHHSKRFGQGRQLHVNIPGPAASLYSSVQTYSSR